MSSLFGTIPPNLRASAGSHAAHRSAHLAVAQSIGPESYVQQGIRCRLDNRNGFRPAFSKLETPPRALLEQLNWLKRAGDHTVGGGVAPKFFPARRTKHNTWPSVTPAIEPLIVTGVSEVLRSSQFLFGPDQIRVFGVIASHTAVFV